MRPVAADRSRVRLVRRVIMVAALCLSRVSSAGCARGCPNASAKERYSALRNIPFRKAELPRGCNRRYDALGSKGKVRTSAESRDHPRFAARAVGARCSEKQLEFI